MIVVFPLGHERMEARRWPLVTLGIIVVCAAVLVWQMLTQSRSEKQLTALLAESLEVVREHPGIEPPPGVARLLGKRSRMEPVASPPARIPKKMQEQRRAEERLSAIEQELDIVESELPSFRFGFWRGGNPLGVVTHAFLHGGILHLVFNLWFLWLAGTSLEDRWGRVAYAGFYLVAAAAGALTHVAFTDNPYLPLIGASGAVAGCMGAFLVIHGAARIRFAYLLSWRFKAGTFEASAYLMLPLWLASELMSLLLPGDGTSHLAHVGGFSFGALAGLALKLTGVDRRLDAAVDVKTTRFEDPRLARAAELGGARRYDEAFTLLDELAREKPASIDVALELLRLAQGACNKKREALAYARLVGAYLAAGMLEPVLDLVRELRVRGLEPDVARDARLAWADALVRRGQRPTAETLYRGLMETDDALGLRAAIAVGTLTAKDGRRGEALEIFLRAQRSAHIDADLSQRVDAQLAWLHGGDPPRSVPPGSVPSR